MLIKKTWCRSQQWAWKWKSSNKISDEKSNQQMKMNFCMFWNSGGFLIKTSVVGLAMNKLNPSYETSCHYYLKKNSPMTHIRVFWLLWRLFEQDKMLTLDSYSSFCIHFAESRPSWRTSHYDKVSCFIKKCVQPSWHFTQKVGCNEASADLFTNSNFCSDTKALKQKAERNA